MKKMILLTWLEEAGFINDRGWKQPREAGDMFYSFVKGNYRFEIYENWDKPYSSYSPIEIRFVDCTKEVRYDSVFNGWMCQDHLLKFKRQISKPLFEEICKHYEI